MGGIPLYEQGTVDTYSCDMELFHVLYFVVHVNDEKIGIALKELPEKQRAFILLYYFRGIVSK